jgi:6-phosphogluconolactonase
MNQASSGGEGPCHVDIDTTGKHLLVANYIEGNVSVLPINRDGTIGGPTDIHQHNGSSVDIERQEGPHPHSANLDPNNRFVYVADLGLDEVCVYELLAEGTLKYREQLSVDVKAGAGPRHFDFHPSGEYAYVINELDSTVTAFSLDGGKLDPIQTLSTLPKEFADTSYTADIHVAKSGRFLYGSNRGHDSIVIFSIDENTGKLTYVSCESTRGIYPRNFEIDPSGLLMLVANQDSDTVLTFNIDQQNGTLERTGHVIDVPYPVCIQLVPLP